MNIQEILTDGGGILLVLLTLVEIAPIKINPWSALAKYVGRAMGVEAIEKKLDSHIQADDERNADWHRARILQFNTELLRNILHTEEDFNEILYNIDCYERYCAEHPEPEKLKWWFWKDRRYPLEERSEQDESSK